MKLGMPGFFTRDDRCDWSIIETLRSTGNDMDRYFAVAIRPMMEKMYKGWRRSSSQCLLKLLNKRCRYGYLDGHHDHDFPGADHTIIAKRKQGEWEYLTQPYQMTWDDIQKAMAMCQKLGLRMDITASGSWHFPGRTLLVTVRKADAPHEYPRSIEDVS